jgi:hypothetical protein
LLILLEILTVPWDKKEISEGGNGNQNVAERNRNDAEGCN